jgi:predicted house-cleaning noncanonical NTP pyrophosphatase (MazG superfamily)
VSQDRLRFIKLIRDDLEKNVGDDGRLQYRKLSRDEHIKELRKKIAEEGLEFGLGGGIGELADIYEAMCCWLELNGKTLGDVILAADMKRRERGSFLEGLGMFMTTTAPPRGD